MQLLVDFFPLLLFFAAYLWQGIFFATGVAIVASVVQIAWIHWKHGRAGVTHWLSLVIIVVFGGATLLLQDETFIKWKPTVLYGLFGAILAVGKIGFGRDLLAYLMKGVNLPPAIWTRLTWAWVAFFAFMGAANWYVAFHFSTDTWVMYKVWGGIGLFVLFAILQGIWLARHATTEETA
jgi:intracellular septation protein